MRGKPKLIRRRRRPSHCENGNASLMRLGMLALSGQTRMGSNETGMYPTKDKKKH